MQLLKAVMWTKEIEAFIDDFLISIELSIVLKENRVALLSRLIGFA